MHIDTTQVNDIEVEGINMSDCPDFSDAFISFATYQGREMTEAELDQLNDDRDFVYEQVLARIF